MTAPPLFFATGRQAPTRLGFSAIFLAICYVAEVAFFPEKLDTQRLPSPPLCQNSLSPSSSRAPLRPFASLARLAALARLNFHPVSTGSHPPFVLPPAALLPPLGAPRRG